MNAVAMPALTQIASFMSSIKTRKVNTSAKPNRPLRSSRLTRSRSSLVSSRNSTRLIPGGKA